MKKFAPEMKGIKKILSFCFELGKVRTIGDGGVFFFLTPFGAKLKKKELTPNQINLCILQKGHCGAIAFNVYLFLFILFITLGRLNIVFSINQLINQINQPPSTMISCFNGLPGLLRRTTLVDERKSLS